MPSTDTYTLPYTTLFRSPLPAERPLQMPWQSDGRRRNRSPLRAVSGCRERAARRRALRIPRPSRAGFLRPEQSCQTLLPATLRSEEHTSELQSQFHLVCRPPTPTLFPTRRSSDLLCPQSGHCKCHGNPMVAAGIDLRSVQFLVAGNAQPVVALFAFRAHRAQVFCDQSNPVRLFYPQLLDRKSTRLNSSHSSISYAVHRHLHSSLHDALPISSARRAATANAMAIRWSPPESISAPCSFWLPGTRSPSSRSSHSAPIARRFFATRAILSDSFTRNSFASRISMPSRVYGPMAASTGSSSIRATDCAPSIVMPVSLPCSILTVPISSP